MRRKTFTSPLRYSTRSRPCLWQVSSGFCSLSKSCSTAFWSIDPSSCCTTGAGPVFLFEESSVFDVSSVFGGGWLPPHANRSASPRMKVNRSIGLFISTSQQARRNDDALNLARAFVDLGDAGIAIVTLDRELRRVAVATVDLHRLVRDARGHLAR